MKRLVALIVNLCAILSVYGIDWTQPFTGITWRFDKVGTDSAKITGFWESLSGNVEVPTKVAGYKVIEIAPRVFKGCGASQITIGAGVRYIGEEAFSGSKKLNRVSFLGEDTALGADLCKDCNFLESVYLPSKLTILPDNVFSGCNNLRFVSLPTTVTTIGNNAFRDCRSLTEYSLPTGAVNIGTGAFAGCTNLLRITLPQLLESIPDELFSNCKSLEGIDIPKGVTNIGSKAFSNCWSLNNVTVPGSVVTMGGSIFLNCTSLRRAVLSHGVGQLAERMFEGCCSLSSLSLPDSLLFIGHFSVAGCDKLLNLTIPRSVKTIDSAGLWNSSGANKHIVFKCAPPLVLGPSLSLNSYKAIGIPAEYFNLWYPFLPSCNGGFTSYNPLFHFYVTWDYTYTISDGEATITGATFKDSGVPRQYCPTTIIIPSFLGGCPCTRIADGAFQNCTTIESVHFYAESPVCEIGDGAFSGCESLSSISVPASLMKVGRNAFAGTMLIKSSEFVWGDWLIEMSDAILTEYVVPDGIRHIADGAFVSAQNLKSVIIGEDVLSVGVDAFDGIPLSEACADGIVCADKWAIGYKGDCHRCLELPEGIHAIADASFAGLNVTNVTINESVKRVGMRAFANCANLKRVVCDPNITIIDDTAFDGCPSDIEIGPIWHRVKFDTNGGVSCEVQDRKVKDKNAIGELPELNGESLHLEFLGWYFDKEGGVRVHSEIPVVDDMTLYAHWKKETCAVTIVPNFKGGQPITNCYEHGSVVGDLGTPIRDDYRFIGWFSDPKGGDQITAEMVVVSNVAVYAHWVGEYRIVYDSNNGLGDMSCQVVDVGSEFCLKTNSFTKDGFVFAGWLGDNDELKYYDGQLINGVFDGYDAGVVTLHAIWVVSGGGYKYIQYDGTSVCIQGVEDDVVEHLFIPRFIDGYAVKKIASRVFAGLTNLVSVEIAEGVEELGDEAFANCTSLLSVALPSSLTQHDVNAFSGCVNVSNVIVSSCSQIDLFRSLKPRVLTFGSRVLEISPGALKNMASLSVVNIPEGVTNICESAFQGCGLDAIKLPRSIKRIGASAFSGCRRREVHIDDLSAWCGIEFDGINANPLLECNLYVSGELVTNLIIPYGVQEIKPYAFALCSSIQTLVLPDGLKIIGDDAFYMSRSLVSVSFSDGIESIGDGAFMSCSFKEIELPHSLKHIGRFSFSYCSKLGRIGFPSALGEISERAFDGCAALAGIVLPNAVSNICAYAFRGCVGLKDVEIPKSVATICNGAFAGCDGLGSISVPFVGNNCHVVSGKESGFGYIFGVNKFGEYLVPRGLTNVEITAACHLPHQAFYECDKIQRVVLHEGITNILPWAFYSCWNLREINIPNGVESIGALAFCDCYRIESLALPKSVRYVGEEAFYSCSRLKEIKIDGALEYVGKDALSGAMLVYVNRDNAETVKNLMNSVVSVYPKLTFVEPYLIMYENTMGCENTNVTSYTVLDSGAFHSLTNPPGMRFLGWEPSEISIGTTGDLVVRALWLVDSFPDVGENPTQEAIAEALTGSADPQLVTNITDGATYNDYREWSETVKGTNGTETAGAQAVKESPNAWVSFALGQDALLNDAPTDEDLSIEAFEPAATDGKFDFTVSVKDVEVGSDAAADNLKKVFGLEGGSSLQGLSSDNVDITFGTPKDGKVKFTAGPNAANADAKTFFMKVKMNP